MIVVPISGFEPERCCHHRSLNPMCLPIPPYRHMKPSFILELSYDSIGGKRRNRTALPVPKTGVHNHYTSFSVAGSDGAARGALGQSQLHYCYGNSLNCSSLPSRQDRFSQSHAPQNIAAVNWIISHLSIIVNTFLKNIYCDYLL